jgi:serine/threonine protein phosphatase 1
MSTYCISDIHGCLDEFTELLQAIEFSANDELYIIGDVIDRGPKPIACLEFVMKQSNARMLLGNHEDMMLDYYNCSAEDRGYHNWLNNGGQETIRDFDALSNDDRRAILNWLAERELYADITVGGRKFFLSHAGLNPDRHHPSEPARGQRTNDLLWMREKFFKRSIRGEHTYIFGHTPTPNRGLHSLRTSSAWVSPRKNQINIDSGCVYGGKLCALRLDDMELFYVYSKQEGGFSQVPKSRKIKK